VSVRVSVPLSDVFVDEHVLAAAGEAVASGWWSMGPRVEEFEKRFAAFVGAEHAFAVANGTAALHIALLGIGCGPGDEVVVPSLNFVAAANTIHHTGARPVFCDVTGSDDLNLDVRDVERALTSRTKAIVALHYGGHPCAVEELVQLAASRGVGVVEDAAHAPGAALGGRACGTFGAAGCFSFFSNKNMPVGEGGMVVTDDDELAERFRLLRSHGMTTLTWDRHRGHAHSYDVVLPGFNYRIDEIRAAIGIVQLGRLEEENARRASVAARYAMELHGTEGLCVPFAERSYLGLDRCAHHLAVLVLPPDTNREAFRAGLREEGIQTSVHYPPIHTFTAYASRSERRLPVTDSLATRVVTLPLFGRMTDEQIEHVTRAVRTLARR
jgi:dTDP-4-amino-4,6-dideoxygalactose transaminase